jgi:hypothetical protein
MGEMLGQAFAHARRPLLQHPRLYELLRYLYDSVFGRIRRMEAYVVKGIARDSTDDMTLLYFGSKSSAHQLASLIYGQINEFLPVGGVLLHGVSALSAISTPEIIAIRVRRPFIREFLKQGYLLLPNVNFTLDMRVSMDDIIKRMSRRRRRDIKKINTLNYSYVICRKSDKDFDFFYHKMYLPYARSRFGKSAYIKPYLESKTVYESNGGLIFVKKDEKPLAGMLFNIHRKTLHAWSFGAHEGDLQFVEELAGEATLLFLIEWAKTQGIESLDYGVSLPFLREGIFTYKKEWGMSVNEQRDDMVCALKMNSINECSLTFLQQNPFVVTDKGKLKGVVFIDHMAGRAELEQIHSRYFFPNIRSLMVVSYYRAHPETISGVEHIAEKLAGSLMIPLRIICRTLREKGLTVDVFEF